MNKLQLLDKRIKEATCCNFDDKCDCTSHSSTCPLDKQGCDLRCTLKELQAARPSILYETAKEVVKEETQSNHLTVDQINEAIAKLNSATNTGTKPSIINVSMDKAIKGMTALSNACKFSADEIKNLGKIPPIDSDLFPKTTGPAPDFKHLETEYYVHDDGKPSEMATYLIRNVDNAYAATKLLRSHLNWIQIESIDIMPEGRVSGRIKEIERPYRAVVRGRRTTPAIVGEWIQGPKFNTPVECVKFNQETTAGTPIDVDARDDLIQDVATVKPFEYTPPEIKAPSMDDMEEFLNQHIQQQARKYAATINVDPDVLVDIPQPVPTEIIPKKPKRKWLRTILWWVISAAGTTAIGIGLKYVLAYYGYSFSF